MPKDRASERGGFCSWPRPELWTKRIRGSILLPGRISSKGPASMRDASDLRHLILRCPRFTSGPPGAPPSTYRFLHHCDPSTRRLLCTCPLSLLFFSSFFPLSALGSHPPPQCHMCSTCDHVVVVPRRSVMTAGIFERVVKTLRVYICKAFL